MITHTPIRALSMGGNATTVLKLGTLSEYVGANKNRRMLRFPCVDESTSGSDEMLFTIEPLFSQERFDIHKKCDSTSNSTKTLWKTLLLA